MTMSKHQTLPTSNTTTPAPRLVRLGDGKRSTNADGGKRDEVDIELQHN